MGTIKIHKVPLLGRLEILSTSVSGGHPECHSRSVARTQKLNPAEIFANSMILSKTVLRIDASHRFQGSAGECRSESSATASKWDYTGRRAKYLSEFLPGFKKLSAKDLFHCDSRDLILCCIEKEAQGFRLMLLFLALLEDDLILVGKPELTLRNIFIIFTGLHVLLKIIDL